MSRAAESSQPTTVPVQLISPAGPIDVQLQLADRTVSLGEVFAAVGLDSDRVVIDGAAPVVADAVPACDVLCAGSMLAAGRIYTPGARALGQTARDVASVVQVAEVAGIDCGRTSELRRGHFHLEEPSTSAANTSWYVAVEHEPHFAVDRRPWHERSGSIETVEVPGGVLALNQPIDCEPGRPGHLRRPPRLLTPDDVGPVELQAPPPTAKPAQPLSWATFVTPIPIGIIMAVFFSPIFALFSALGPAVALGRWVEGRRRFRRESSARAAALVQMTTDIEAQLIDQVERIARQRWAQSPHVSELWRRARMQSVRLWERRPGQPGFLQLTLGVGPDAINPVLAGVAPCPEAHGPAITRRLSRPVPHLVDLAAEHGLGVWGERQYVVAQVRSLLLQLVTLHGPADVSVGVLCSPSRSQTWDFIKWLPHCRTALVADDAASVCAGLEVDGAGSATSPFGSKPFRPASMHQPGQDARSGLDHMVTVLVVDHPSADIAAVERAARAASVELRVIALAASATSLPAVCSALLEMAENTSRLSSLANRSSGLAVCPAGVSNETAVSWARSLAALVDPESPALAQAELAEVNLFALTGPVASADLAHRWANATVGQRPRAAIGLGAGGPVVVDLGSDGPHALVAGTTGSGKSELLRTLVMSLAIECSPDHLNFVLVDFKGGGAFDVCSRLPHVVGLITDLDEHLVGRALRSLQSELLRREHLFRELGVSSFDHAVHQATEPIARLVIVIDEFAALATDYSELLHAIVDLAARGRSLGMHLVLATQRPSGVVDQKIRANTNLRIALRVQDAIDSHDVVGVPDAATIDRRRPGRAIVSVGGDRPFSVQTGYGGVLDRQAERCRVRPFVLAVAAGLEDVEGAPLSSARAVEPRRTEFETALAEIEVAAASLGCSPRPLWTDPLPPSLDWIELGTRVLSSAGEESSQGYPLGLVDVPDEQMQVPWRWVPSAGALVLFGASAPCAGRVLTALGCAVATAAEQCHMYIIDGDAGRVGSLNGLPDVGAYVTIDEHDRVQRTVALMERTLRQRRQSDEAHTAQFQRSMLLIDNIAAVLAEFADLERAAMVDRLAALARDGAALGVHLVVTARTVRDVPHRLAQQIPQRMTMQLADPAGYLALGVKSRDLVDLPDMRAIELATGRLVQLVEPPDALDLVNTLSSGADTSSAGRPGRQVAPLPVHAFPSAVSLHDLPAASASTDGHLVVPIAIGELDLEPCELVLRPGQHALVVGPRGGGRSSALRSIAMQLQRGDLSVSVYVVGAVASALCEDEVSNRLLETEDEIDELCTRADRCADRCIVLVDDADQLEGGVAAALSRLVAKQSRSLHVVAAATPDFARSSHAWTAPLRSTATGIYVGCDRFDGDVLRTRLPMVAGLGTIAGRGHVVVGGRATAVQLALADVSTSDRS